MIRSRQSISTKFGTSSTIFVSVFLPSNASDPSMNLAICLICGRVVLNGSRFRKKIDNFSLISIICFMVISPGAGLYPVPITISNFRGFKLF